MDEVEKYLESKLQERVLAGNLRQLTTDRAQVDFFSNDYLGLVTNNILGQPLQAAPNRIQANGSTGSRLLSGNSKAAEELENTIAQFHNAEAALLFNSGYDANIGLLACVTNRHTTILYDEYCHASIIDGIRLSQSEKCYKFRHNNLEDLEAKLNRTTGAVIIVIESVYSMDGDIAPLTEIVALANNKGAALIVDEAHATGIFGTKGEGLVCSLHLETKVFARVHTFGKALGCHGAVVTGSSLLKNYLVNFARSFIYTTALPLHAVASIKAAYDYLSGTEAPNRELHGLITYFCNAISKSGMEGWKESMSPIQVLIAGSNEKAKRMATALQQAGLQVNPILHPTVPMGMERLRICLHSFNTKEQIDTLMKVLSTSK